LAVSPPATNETARNETAAAAGGERPGRKLLATVFNKHTGRVSGGAGGFAGARGGLGGGGNGGGGGGGWSKGKSSSSSSSSSSGSSGGGGGMDAGIFGDLILGGGGAGSGSPFGGGFSASGLVRTSHVLF
jgi:hypothetical protein